MQKKAPVYTRSIGDLGCYSNNYQHWPFLPYSITTNIRCYQLWSDTVCNMQPTSEKQSFLEKLSCEEDSLKENRFYFNQNHDKPLSKEVKDLTMKLDC